MKDDIKDHYSGLVDEYIDQYNPEYLDKLPEYPANYFRLSLIRNLLTRKKCRRLLDIGAGSGVPTKTIAQDLGSEEVVAFDFTEEMVLTLRKTLTTTNIKKVEVFSADASQPESYKTAVRNGKFDVALMLGVMPHVSNDLEVLRYVRESLVTGGQAFVSFRNQLFDLFTMNRLTHQFFLEHLLSPVDLSIRKSTGEELESRLEMTKPPIRRVNATGGLGYDQILAKSHNPLQVQDLFLSAGFKECSIHWYHFHAALPWLDGAKVAKSAFRSASMQLEGRDDWRGFFLCSAFLVRAVV